MEIYKKLILINWTTVVNLSMIISDTFPVIWMSCVYKLNGNAEFLNGPLTIDPHPQSITYDSKKNSTMFTGL